MTHPAESAPPPSLHDDGEDAETLAFFLTHFEPEEQTRPGWLAFLEGLWAVGREGSEGGDDA